MNNAIYMFGCACGAKGRPASVVQSKISATIFNIKRDAEKMKQYLEYLTEAGIEQKDYPSIVVENNGERITLLEKWKSPL